MAIKIAVIGAGSVTFTRRMVRDILCVPELQDTEFALMDINAHNLEMARQLCAWDVEAARLPARLTGTTDRREALEGAHYVFSFIRVGGLEGFATDIDIPLKYGVDQCVGDTLGPGGIMYAQRTIPVLLGICRDISEVGAAGCLLLNYSNPMAMNTWACLDYGYGVPLVGLCHGVPSSAAMIAEVLGVPPAELDYIAAGINHQTWFVSAKHRGVERVHELPELFPQHPQYSRTEKVRIDMLQRFGYWSTESNGHLSEYLPWYRKRPEEIERWIDLGSWISGETGGYLRVCREHRYRYEQELPHWLQQPPWSVAPAERSNEHGSYIIEALETGRVYRGHFNVRNRGCLTNLPPDCVVEVPGYVDGTGLHTPILGELPLGPAAVCNASLSVQRLAKEAAVHGDDALLRQALLLDPLTGAVCNPPEVWQMADELLVAGEAWLPQYAEAIAAARQRRAAGDLLPTREGYRGAARLPTKSAEQIAQEKSGSDQAPM